MLSPNIPISSATSQPTKPSPLVELPDAAGDGGLAVLACALASRRDGLGVDDRLAERLVLAIPGLRRARFDHHLLLAAALRAAAIDRIASSFAERHPTGSGVSAPGGLSTRGVRLSGLLPWLDIDEAPIGQFKKSFWPRARGYRRRVVGEKPGSWELEILRGSSPLFIVLDDAWASIGEAKWHGALEVLSRRLPPHSEVVAVRAPDSPIGRLDVGGALAQGAVALDNQRYPTLRHVAPSEQSKPVRSLRGQVRRLQRHGAPQLEHMAVV